MVVTPGGPVLDPNSLLSIDGAVDLDFGNFSGGGVDAIGGYFYSAFNSGTLLGGNIELLFSDGFTTDVFSAAGGVPQFFGYIATPGTQLTRLLVHSPSNLAAVDRLTVGNVAFQVPEPSTLCMVVTAALLGLLGLRALRTRAVSLSPVPPTPGSARRGRRQNRAGRCSTRRR